MFQLNSTDFSFRVRSSGQRKLIYDIIRRKYVTLTPEEWVRQHVIHFLIQALGYPAGVLAVERELELNGLRKRTDLVVYNRSGHAVLLVECKAPEVKLGQAVADQAARYNMQLQVNYLWLTNGTQHYICRLDAEAKRWEVLQQLPPYEALN